MTENVRDANAQGKGWSGSLGNAGAHQPCPSPNEVSPDVTSRTAAHLTAAWGWAR